MTTNTRKFKIVYRSGNMKIIYGKTYDDNILEANINLSIQPLIGMEEKINVLFSPLVLHNLLALLSHSYSYRNSTNLRSLLISENTDASIKSYADFVSFLDSLKNNYLHLSSKVFVQNNCKLESHFKDLINKFQYGIETVDFTTPELYKNINSFFVEKTNNLIQDLVMNNVGIETCLAVLNSVHFKQKWNQVFTLDDYPTAFNLNKNESIETQMMKIKGNINCVFKGAYSAIELPFGCQNFSMVFILPHGEYNLQDQANCFSRLEYIVNDMKKEEMEVLVPRLKIEHILDCNNLFKNLNLEQEINKINIFGMLENESFLKYVQTDLKGYISINEEGVEAASGLSTTIAPSEFDDMTASSDKLNILEMNVQTTISNRFAKTLVTNKVQNSNTFSEEANFSVVLPETAFITEFIMEVNGKTYKSYINKKEEAKTLYNEAVGLGKSAGIVEADTRNSTQFEVSVNLEPKSVAVFSLTYEQMLQRVHDQYELVLNVDPGQIVDKMNVEVNINENKPIKFVNTPPLRSGNEVDPLIEEYLKPSSDIKMVNSSTCIVKFNMDAKEQWKISNYMGTNSFAGQFVVQYDVERDPKDGEILVQDGYFVHFFAPNDLDVLPKNVVFVLDTSTSMEGRNLDQLKDAMMAILFDLNKGDRISIIEFNKSVIMWDINSNKSETISCETFKNFEDPFENLSQLSLPAPFVINDVNVDQAKKVVQKLESQGPTFMIGGLMTGLYMLKLEEEKTSSHQPIMIFLTDGAPTVGVSSTSAIVDKVTKLNSFYNRVPIFSLSFGRGADKLFLRLLSLKNFGFSKHIYADADASLQLQSFYKQICSPLLANVVFRYEDDVTEVIKNHFPIYFKGGELVVSGQCKGDSLSSTINGYGPKGLLHLASIVQNPVTSLKRLWAYLTVKQLLEEKDVVDNNEELIKRATDLALKHSFVTEVTSLVVVKPDEILNTTKTNNTQPISVNNTQSVSDNNTQSVSDNNTQSVSDNNTQSVSDNNTQSVSDNNTQSVSDNNTQSVSDNNTQSVSDNNTQSVSDNNTQSVSVNNTQSVSDNNTQSVSDNNTQSVSDNNTQSVSDNNTQSVSDNNTQSVSDNDPGSLLDENSQDIRPLIPISVKKKVVRKRMIKNQRKKGTNSEGFKVEEVEVMENIGLKFVLNRPFLMALMLRKGDKKMIIFAGWVRKPSY